MANAMLEEEFQSSHPDLIVLANQQQHQEQQASSNFDDDMDRKPKASHLPPPTRTKSVEFAILPPPNKRTRVAASTGSTWTAKQVVDGT